MAMDYAGNKEPVLINAYNKLLDLINQAEWDGDPAKVCSMAESALSMATITLSEGDFRVIDTMKGWKWQISAYIALHYDALIQQDQAERVNNRQAARTRETGEKLRAEIARMIDRKIIRICIFSFRHTILKPLCVKDEFKESLGFTPDKALTELENELNFMFQVSGIELNLRGE